MIIDACGRSCPEPVLMTKQGLKQNPNGVTVTVDNNIAVENISRFAKNSGYEVAVSEKNGIFTLELTR